MKEVSNNMNYTVESHRLPENLMAPPSRALTSLQENEDKKASVQTAKVDFVNIKKLVNIPHAIRNDQNGTLDESKYREEFSFERHTLKALGEAKLANFKEEGPTAEVDLNNPRIVSLKEERKLFVETEKEEVQTWSLALKILAVVIACMAIVNAVFSMVYIFALATNSNVNVIKNTVPLTVNLAASMWMIHVSLKTGRTSGIHLSESEFFTSYFKLSIITIIVLLIQLGLMSNFESIPELLERTKDLYVSPREPQAEKRKAEAYVGLGYLIVWANCIFNLATVGLGAVLAYMLRKHMRVKETCELEQKALPLGYQIYDKLKGESVCKGDTLTVDPYKV